MSQETLNQLSAALESDKALEAKMRAAKNLEDVVSIAAGHGHAVTLEDLRTSTLAASEELSDRELEGVTGGTAKKPPKKDQQEYLKVVLSDILIS